MDFPKHIFKAYDIRGLVDGELSEELAYNIGRAYVRFLRTKGADLSKYIVVGRDMRETSGPFSREVIRAITDEGVNVVDIGMATTPLFNFASAHYHDHVAGIMVTASHNPASYNGFKMTLGDGMPVGQGSGIEQVRDFVEAADFTDSESKGEVTKKDVLPDYISRIFELVPKESIKPLKIVIDAGNGMGKVTFTQWLKDLPVDVEYMYLEPDGTFPNHEANPIKTETLIDLQTKVVETGADFGFALDGDADRIGLVDEKGQVVDASFVSALVGLEVLGQHPGAKMLYDLRQSMIVPEVWLAAGAASAEKTVVGHAHIKKQMHETDAMYAGELSLHLYYRDMYYLECTDLSLLNLLHLISREGKTISQLVEPMKKFYHSGEINFEVEEKDKMMQKIEDHFKDGATEISHLDGVWIGFDWGWLNVRKSNTEGVLRLNLEAKTVDEMKKRVEEVSGIINI
ncbi:MAG: phosphomannomutase/phosphoglucomutase [Candidatus Magasanikbacteria bacterium]